MEIIFKKLKFIDKYGFVKSIKLKGNHISIELNGGWMLYEQFGGWNTKKGNDKALNFYNKLLTK